MSAAPPVWNRGLIHVLSGVLLSIVGLLLLLVIIAIALGDADVLEEEYVAGLVITVIYTLMALLAASLIGRGRPPGLMIGAIVLAYGSVACWNMLIFDTLDLSWEAEEYLAQFSTTCTILSIALLYDGALRVLETKSPRVMRLRSGVLALAMVFWSSVLITMWLSEFIEYLIPGRMLSVLVSTLFVLGVLTLMGPLSVRAAHHGEKKRLTRASSSLAKAFHLHLDCPGCQEPIEAAEGPARCGVCGFTMVIEVEEPRCDCGYLIFEQTSTQCPECGKPIPEDEQWVIPPEDHEPMPAG